MTPIVQYSNIEYFMPFMFCNDIYIPALHKLLENEVNPIKYVYGSPYCEWGIGARSAIFKYNNLNYIESYLNKIKNKYNYIPVFTFTNLNIKEKLNDKYANNLLDIACSLDCRLIVATEELYKHIKQRYPNAKIHSSVIIPSVKIIEEKDFDETKFYNEMLDKCEVVVIRPEYAMDNIDKLDKMLSDISRIEVLINQNCHYNCPFHRQHYTFMEEIDKCTNRDDVKYHTMANGEEFSLCPKYKKDYKSVQLSGEQISKLVDLGIKKLKIQGRSLTFDMLFDQLYKNFFNNEYTKEEIKNKLDSVCAGMIEHNRKMALLFV